MLYRHFGFISFFKCFKINLLLYVNRQTDRQTDTPSVAKSRSSVVERDKNDTHALAA